MSEHLATPRHGNELFSWDAIRLAVQLTGGLDPWFLWGAGSGQDSLPFTPVVVASMGPIAMSPSGQGIEHDTKIAELVAEHWLEAQRSKEVTKPHQRRTQLARRLDEIRERIKASGQPLMSWDDIDRELSELRGEAP